MPRPILSPEERVLKLAKTKEKLATGWGARNDRTPPKLRLWMDQKAEKRLADKQAGDRQKLDDIEALMAEAPERRSIPAVLMPPELRPRFLDGNKIPRGQMEALRGQTDMTHGDMPPARRNARESRGLLADRFISELYDDWKEHGTATLSLVRRDRPHEYLKIIAALMPRDITVAAAPLGEISDEDLARLIADVRLLSTPAFEGEAGEGAGASRPQELHIDAVSEIGAAAPGSLPKAYGVLRRGGGA